jgi:hypothetical protein
MRSFGELQIWLLEWLGTHTEQELALAMLGLYHIWLARNDARDNALIESPNVTVERVCFLWDEWQHVQDKQQEEMKQSEVHWTKPAAGWLKVNCDGAFLALDGRGGGGCWNYALEAIIKMLLL